MLNVYLRQTYAEELLRREQEKLNSSEDLIRWEDTNEKLRRKKIDDIHRLLETSTFRRPTLSEFT